MKNEVKKYTVSIFGDTYTLVSDESEVDVVKAAVNVDGLIKEVVQKMPNLSNYNAAILVSLKLALKHVVLETEYTNNNHVIKKMIAHIEDKL